MLTSVFSCIEFCWNINITVCYATAFSDFWSSFLWLLIAINGEVNDACKNERIVLKKEKEKRIMMQWFRCAGHRNHYGRASESHSEELADDLEDEKIPGGPGINERELWSLHRAVPGLRHHDPRTTTIRQHYYPEVNFSSAGFHFDLLLTKASTLATNYRVRFLRSDSLTQHINISKTDLQSQNYPCLMRGTNVK